MTTIATDGRMMVADGLSTSSGIVISECAVKMHQLEDGRVFGGCGYYHEVMSVVRWLEAGEPDERPTVDQDFMGLLLSDDGAELIEHGMARQRCVMPVAIGSGRDIAIGAMMAGKGPIEAVKLACERDVYSGGQITAKTLP